MVSLKPGPSDRRAFVGQFLLTPNGADVSEVPSYIRVLSMRSFGFTDGNLVWLTKKKNVMKCSAWETATV